MAEITSKEILNKSELNSFVMLFDDVTTDVAKEIVQWILEANFSNDKPSMLNMLINSPGGSLTAAFSIIDVMASSIIPIRTIGLGEISSAGLMIFIAGTKGQRILTPNTSIMSHQWSGGAMGKKHELLATRREHELVEERMLRHYVTYTGMTEVRIKKYLLPEADVHLNDQEAIKYGLCDKVALIR